MGMLFNGYQPIDLKKLYLTTKGNGSLSKPRRGLGEKVSDYIGSKLRAAGMSKRMAGKFAALPELSPIGAFTTAFDLGGNLRRSEYGSAAMNAVGTALNAIPDAGGTAKAMFLGVMAKNADKAALKKAQGMFAKGASRDDIWNKTGWFKGGDDKWRFEIDDSASGFRRDRLDTQHHQGRRYEVGRLEEALEHPEFHNAYPSAGQAEVANYSFAGEGSSGVYHPPGSMMPEQIAMWDDGSRSTLHHEVQHQIQNIEGFAGGGNSKYAPTAENPEWAKWNAPENRALSEEYANLTESSAYLAERDAWNAEWDRLFAPRLDALEAAQDAAGRSGFDNFQPQIEALFEEAKRFEATKFPSLRRAQELADAGIVREPPRNLSGDQVYRRLAGEVEARNVQHRLDWTAEQRRATPPWMTEDVPAYQQIIRFK